MAAAERALELLRLGTQDATATFREDQENAIRHIVEGRGRLLVVQKTGWGKSSVYFIATKLLREQGAGPALLISPLLALMRNQIAAAVRMGVRAVTINSENKEEWQDLEMKLRRDEIDILLISPERLANEHFRNDVLGSVADRISLLVVDEAHCISDWGHDFRPHYRFIERMVRLMPANLRLLGTTATANNRVLEDLQNVLGPNLTVSRGDLSRSSLLLQTIRMPGQAERMAWLATYVPKINGSGIVYTLTIRDAEQVARWLQSCGISAESYSSESGDRRVQLENALLENRVKALIATTSLGMGFDKPDLAFVVHYQTPGSVVAYYQQIGRAGRAMAAARCVLLSGEEETEITDYFIESAFPSREEVAEVIETLSHAPDGLTINELMRRLNLSRGRIDKALLLLSLESPAPVVKQGPKWLQTAVNLNESFWQRAERLTALRRAEQRQMQEYVGLTNGHMEFLIRALDSDPSGYQPPNLAPLPTDPDAGLFDEALKFLRRSGLLLAPRKMWPAGGLPKLGVKGKIAPEHQAQTGRVLCRWGDAGWGRNIRNGKYHDRHFSDDLVEASAALVSKWAPAPAPQWVTCIASRRHPELVPDFARRLAKQLGLPFHESLIKTDDRPEQKSMANSIQQARNIDGAFAVAAATLPTGPMLLIDDMVDSKWTFTVATYLLTSHGSGPVHPFALAAAGQTE
jgi:ATP-dependent DNA helicase RecQ